MNSLKIEIVDFGPITLSESPDNKGMVRMHILDEEGQDSPELHVDLEASEVKRLIRGLTFMMDEIKDKK